MPRRCCLMFEAQTHLVRVSCLERPMLLALSDMCVGHL